MREEAAPTVGVVEVQDYQFVWTLVRQERDSASSGNPDWPCPRKGCDGFLIARNRKNGSSQYAVCDVCCRSDGPSTCQAFYNLNKKHWESSDNPRVCDWCDADTCDSPSIGVPNEGAESLTKRQFHFFVLSEFYVCCQLLMLIFFFPLSVCLLPCDIGKTLLID